MQNPTPPTLSAGAPVEPPRHSVGHRSFVLVDLRRDGRDVAVEAWYPALDDSRQRSSYEILPGVAYLSALALEAAPVHTGRRPLVLVSHGRTGTRLTSSTLCEALAARGAIVLSIEHRGDALLDWLTGQQVTDDVNEANRVADAMFVLDSVRHASEGVPLDIANAIDHDATVLMGHSYGAYTAFATAAGARGAPAHDGIAGVIGLQPYTRTMSDGLLGRLRVPVMLVASSMDRTTPASTDVDRPWALVPGRPLWRLDLHRSGHQASSDIALYAELAGHVPDLPDLVRDYLTASVDRPDDGAPAVPWRSVVALQVDACWRFIEDVVDPSTPSDNLGDDLLAAHGSVPATLHRYA